MGSKDTRLIVPLAIPLLNNPNKKMVCHLEDILGPIWPCQNLIPLLDELEGESVNVPVVEEIILETFPSVPIFLGPPSVMRGCLLWHAPFAAGVPNVYPPSTQQ